jgi:tetratricopeptide (TPR) repeat protein
MNSLIPSIDITIPDINFSEFNITTQPTNNMSSKSGVTLCLNMIVKNESRVITRLLNSVLPIIDTYLICDTGSTDDTPNIIRNFFLQHNIPGEVITEPFKNFGYNRTFALKSARGRATYALLLDADMIFKIEPNFDKQALTADYYLITQKGGGLSYYNTRLIKLDIDAKCVGPTHEYYDLPQGSRSDKLNTLWIDDIGDGGCKADKFDRDIRLLKGGIEEEPNNGRYYFYLANSYFNSGRHAESIPYYEKRIELAGWSEEVFYSGLNLGHAYMSTGQQEKAIFTWMQAYETQPSRSETIYEITKYYREKGKNKLGMAFCLLGKSIPYPKNDTLFIHTEVYESGFDYELSILGYYNNYPNLNKVVCKLMNYNKHSYNNLLSNYKFYCPKLSKYMIRKVGGNLIKENIDVCGTKYEMNASNPCIFKIGSRYMINLRFVNYFLNNNGTYHFPVNDGKIVTVNKILELDDNLNFKNEIEPIILMPDNNNLRYVGMEDIKPFCLSGNSNGKTISFIGTCQNPINGHISMGYGELDITNNKNNMSFNYDVVNTQFNKDCEKNWVFYESTENDGSKKLNIIYKWDNLTIGQVTKKEIENERQTLYLDITTNKKMPPFFRDVRGSSNGCEFENEVWFLCHVVEYGSPRIYYHFFAVFYKETMEIKKWSNLFSFEGEKIEYALGLIVEENRIVISYSKWDRDAAIGIFDKFKIEMELFD